MARSRAPSKLKVKLVTDVLLEDELPRPRPVPVEPSPVVPVEVVGVSVDPKALPEVVEEVPAAEATAPRPMLAIDTVSEVWMPIPLSGFNSCSGTCCVTPLAST